MTSLKIYECLPAKEYSTLNPLPLDPLLKLLSVRETTLLEEKKSNGLSSLPQKMCVPYVLEKL